MSSEIKIFFFLAQQNEKVRKASGGGRTAGLSNRLHEGQVKNHGIPIGREACRALTGVLQQFGPKRCQLFREVETKTLMVRWLSFRLILWERACR